MDDNSLLNKLNAISNYFESGTAEQSGRSIDGIDMQQKDLWTELLDIYETGDREQLLFTVGRIAQLSWPEEERLWWSMVMLLKCDADSEQLRSLISDAKNFHHKNQKVERTVKHISTLLVEQEAQKKETYEKAEIENMKKPLLEKEKAAEIARNNLQQHRATQN